MNSETQKSTLHAKYNKQQTELHYRVFNEAPVFITIRYHKTPVYFWPPLIIRFSKDAIKQCKH